MQHSYEMQTSREGCKSGGMSLPRLSLYRHDMRCSPQDPHASFPSSHALIGCRFAPYLFPVFAQATREAISRLTYLPCVTWREDSLLLPSLQQHQPARDSFFARMPVRSLLGSLRSRDVPRPDMRCCNLGCRLIARSDGSSRRPSASLLVIVSLKRTKLHSSFEFKAEVSSTARLSCIACCCCCRLFATSQFTASPSQFPAPLCWHPISSLAFVIRSNAEQDGECVQQATASYQVLVAVLIDDSDCCCRATQVLLEVLLVIGC